MSNQVKSISNITPISNPYQIYIRSDTQILHLRIPLNLPIELSPPPAKGLLPVAPDWKEPGPSGTPGPPSPCGFPVGMKSLL